MEYTIDAVANKMLVMIIIAAVIIAAAGAVFHREMGAALAFAFGVAMSAGVNAFKVFLLKKAVNTAVGMGTSRAATNHLRVQYFLRYLATAVVLVAAVFIPFVDFFGAVFGIFTLAIASYGLKFFIKDDQAMADVAFAPASMSAEDTIEEMKKIADEHEKTNG
ncbi:MAG: hypothetical protein FWC78_02285 [Defluviitaleaceae bacterium]|nr:hypothetical protein [Defluviitaleaceae bacterium]